MSNGTFSTGMNKIQTEKILEIAKLLYDKGLIPKPNKYNVTKYGLIKLLEAFDVVNTGLIIPLEKVPAGGVKIAEKKSKTKK